MPGLIEDRRLARKARRAERREKRESRKAERLGRRDRKKELKENIKAKRKSGKYSANDKSFFRRAAKNKGLSLREYYEKYVN